MDQQPPPRIGRVTLPELWAVLKDGLYDFRAAPQFGLFFAALAVLGGALLIWLGAGALTWTLTISLAFPLAAPFAAVGLYEVSRRIEDDEPLRWDAVLGVVWQERNRQIPWAGAVIALYVLFWTFLAHMLFALIVGLHPAPQMQTLGGLLASDVGLRLVLAEVAVGGVLAFVLFALTAVSLPMMLEREVDFVTAMLTSAAVVRANPLTMILWAAIVAGLTVLALLPWLLGLLFVWPVLGHATWHLYRRALYQPV